MREHHFDAPKHTPFAQQLRDGPNMKACNIITMIAGYGFAPTRETREDTSLPARHSIARIE